MAGSVSFLTSVQLQYFSTIAPILSGVICALSRPLIFFFNFPKMRMRVTEFTESQLASITSSNMKAID
jgi:hypothetical protein